MPKQRYLAIALMLTFVSACGPVDDPAPIADDLRKTHRCGDGICSSNETCSSCPSDCGMCSMPDLAQPPASTPDMAQPPASTPDMAQPPASTPDMASPSGAPPAVGVPAGYTVVLASGSGVKCDGVTDDTAAIQSALKSLGSNQALQLPAGTCVTSNTLRIGTSRSNQMLYGAGPDSTIIQATNPAYSAVVVSQSSNIILEGFQVYSTSATTRINNGNAFGVYVQQSSNITVDHIKVQKVAGAGILFDHVNGGLIQNSEDDDSLADAFHVCCGSQNVTVQFNVANRPGDDCFPSIGYTSSGQPNVNINFMDNVCHDGHAGGVAYEGTQGGKAYRNQIYHPGRSCLRVASWNSYPVFPGFNIDFQDNYGEQCVYKTTTGHSGIMIFTNYSNISNVTFENNTIVNPLTGIGVRAFGQNGATVDTTTLTGTIIKGATTCYSIEAGATVSYSGGSCN